MKINKKHIKSVVDKVIYELENEEFNSIVAETNIYKLADIIFNIIEVDVVEEKKLSDIQLQLWENYPHEEDFAIEDNHFLKIFDEIVGPYVSPIKCFRNSCDLIYSTQIQIENNKISMWSIFNPKHEDGVDFGYVKKFNVSF